MEVKLILVGNKFKNFSIDKKGVLTPSEFLERIRETPDIPNCTFTLMIGQGVSDRQIHILKIALQKTSHRLNILNDCGKERSNRVLTHKHKIKNRMISIPSKINRNTYESYLILDDRCAEMSDHITGQHVQGMILIEAARQMTLAVTEHFFITEGNRKDIHFVTNELSIKFLEFIFPCEIKLIYHILDFKEKLRTNMRFKVQIDFYQEDIVKTRLIYDFSTYSKHYLIATEQMLAQKSLQFYLREKTCS